MSELRIGNNQNYGLKEHNRYTSFIQEQATLLRFFLKTTGVVAERFRLTASERNDAALRTAITDLRVSENVNDRRSVIIAPGQAIDSQLRLINNPAGATPTSYLIPTNFTGTQDLYARYATTELEVGTCNLATDGNVTGIGTEFLSVLRPENDNPTIIRFESTQNAGDYLIQTLTDDLRMVLIGDSFVAEQGLRYKVVGSFENGVVLSGTDTRRDIYRYDHIEFVIDIQDRASITSNSYDPDLIPLARITRSGNNWFLQQDIRRFASL